MKGYLNLKRFTLNSLWTPWILFFAGVIVYKYLFGMEGIFSFFLKLTDILKPFVWGFAVAYIINIPAGKISFLLKKYTPIDNKSKTAAVVITYAIVILICILVVTLIFPPLRESIAELAKNMPEYYTRVMDFLQSRNYIDISGYMKNMLADIQNNMSFFNMGSYIKNIMNFTGNIADIFIAAVVSVYTVISGDHIKDKIIHLSRKLIPKNICVIIGKYIKILDRVFSKYIASQGADALVIMILSVIIMGVMRVKYALILGIIIGVFNMIPYIGAFVSIFFAVLLTFITGNMSQAMWLLVMLIILQQADANFISVRIVGQSLDLDPIEVIFAIAVGGGFFGAAGMLAAVPFFAAAKDILSDMLENINTADI